MKWPFSNCLVYFCFYHCFVQGGPGIHLEQNQKRIESILEHKQATGFVITAIVVVFQTLFEN